MKDITGIPVKPLDLELNLELREVLAGNKIRITKDKPGVDVLKKFIDPVVYKSKNEYLIFDRRKLCFPRKVEREKVLEWIVL